MYIGTFTSEAVSLPVEFALHHRNNIIFFDYQSTSCDTHSPGANFKFVCLIFVEMQKAYFFKEKPVALISVLFLLNYNAA
jgi:hypothetical protein